MSEDEIIEEMLAAYLGVVKVDLSSTGDLTASMGRAYAVARRRVLEETDEQSKRCGGSGWRKVPEAVRRPCIGCVDCRARP